MTCDDDGEVAAMTSVDDGVVDDPSDAHGLRAAFGEDPIGAVLPLAKTPRPTHPEWQHVAVIIPAKDEGDRIAATVTSAATIPLVDLVVVVDDGSSDDTLEIAREAGAIGVRHSHNQGKAAAMETGARVAADHEIDGAPPRLLLFIDGDLGATAANTAPLVPPVLAGEADMTIALLPRQAGAGGRGLVVNRARNSIYAATGWEATQPLSGMRCLTREAFEAALPLARGWGVETALTTDLLRQGYVALEVPCELKHRASANNFRGTLHRAGQYRDVVLATTLRPLLHRR